MSLTGQIFERELSILIGQKRYSNIPAGNKLDELISYLFAGDYEACLKHDELKSVWRCKPEVNDCDTLNSYLVECVSGYVDVDQPDEFRQLVILIHGVAALQLFIQNNWTGPPSSVPSGEIINSLLGEMVHNSNLLPGEDDIVKGILNHAVKSLSVDETLYAKTATPEYLWLARILLFSCSESITLCETYDWWSLRCIRIHQDMLDGRSPTLHNEAMHCIQQVAMMESLMINEKLLQIQYHLEAAQICSYYYEFSKAKEHSNSATKLAGLKVTTSGALGKRTYHQVEDKAQLILKIERDNSLDLSCFDQPSKTEVPTDVDLNDAIRRDKIMFQNAEDDEVPDLLPEEQGIILNMFFQIQKTNAVHKLIDEELLVYLSAVLSQPKLWSIQTTALFLRSRLESSHHRSVQRSMTQLQELVSNFQKTNPIASDRLHLFHCVAMPNIWKVELKLANLMRTVGMVNGALEIYLRLEMWNNVIFCYQILQKKGLAEEIIRQQLAVKETPNLWCSLGDVTNDLQYYEKAWELSDHRSARSQRSIGQYYFNRKEYAECIPFFQKSLELNNLQLDASSNLAYAAMQAEDWEVAASAYRDCLNLEPDNFQAWNNLANVYLKLKQKTRAWKTLQEALRCDFNNWRIWENYMVVSITCAAFDEGIVAYHRILDLKEKHVDVALLGVLARAVICDLSDNDGNPSGRLKQKLLQLFGRLTSQVTSNSRVWTLYANVTAGGNSDDPTLAEKIIQYRQRAQSCAVQQPGWEKRPEACEEVAKLSVDLADAYLKSSDSGRNAERKQQFLTSAKLMLRGVNTKLKQYQQSAPDFKASDSLVRLMLKMDEILADIESKM